MARIRTIKPEFFRHEELYEAETHYALPLRIAFAGLWTVADREGRFTWKPRALKLDCLPYDQCDFDRVLTALAERGFIHRYTVDGTTYGCIPSWDKHQVINVREAQSTIPANPDPMHAHARTCVHITEPVHYTGEGKGKEKEGKGKGRESAASVATPDGVSDSVWSDFLKLRKTKKAAITPTAIDGIASEAAKAGISLDEALSMCCVRGWSGFNADWVKSSGPKFGENKQEAVEARNREVVRRLLEREASEQEPGLNLLTNLRPD